MEVQSQIGYIKKTILKIGLVIFFINLCTISFSQNDVVFTKTSNITKNKKYEAIASTQNISGKGIGENLKEENDKKVESSKTDNIFNFSELHKILIGIILLFLIIAIFYIYHFYRLKKETTRVKSLENKLNNREDEYERIFNSMQDVYYRIDKNGIIVSVSPSFYKLIGYKPSEVLGKYDSDFYMDSSDRETFIKELISNGDINDCFILLKNKSGAPVPISLNTRVLYDIKGHVSGFEGILRDVSKTVLSEKKLKSSEQELKLATEISKLGISEYFPELNTIEINEILSVFLFGDTNTKKLGFNQLSNLIHPEDYQRVVSGFDQLLEDKISEYELEFRIAGAFGRFIWFNSKFVKMHDSDQSDIVKILGVHLYIDELKTMLIRLQHDQRKLETIYNSVHIMLIVTDKFSNIKEVNDVVTAETGMLKEKLIGNPISCICKDLTLGVQDEQSDLYGELESVVRESAAKMENVYNREINCKLIGNNTDLIQNVYDLSTTVFSVENDLRILVSIVDITDRKIYELEAERTRVLLEENSKLKSDFISNLSYEIRTPINSIMGFVSLLKSKSVSNEQKETYVEIIKDSSDKLLKIIENVIELSKAEFNELDVRKADFSIYNLIQNIDESFAGRIKDTEVEFIKEINIPIEKSIYNSDFQKIRTVLERIMENAIKFTKKGHIRFGAFYEKENLCFYIADTGVGIEHPELLFNSSPVVETDLYEFEDNNRGIGISLRICKAYIEILGGELIVESKIGTGSKFSFVLPVVSISPESELTNKNIEIKAKILIVEDEDYNYNYLVQILEMEGYDYLIAEDGQKAIDTVKEHPEIDLILMDIRMPGIDGLEAARIIKSFNPKVPIIAQTAYSFDTQEDMQMEQYCDDYIQKPIVSKILLNKIQKLLNK